MTSAMFTSPLSSDYHLPPDESGNIKKEILSPMRKQDSPTSDKVESRNQTLMSDADNDESMNVEADSPGQLIIMSPGKDDSSMEEDSSLTFNYHGDTLSPQHPRNFPVTPLIENSIEMFYCHLCSFSGSSRDQFNAHLDSHFEHKCDKCDYTSRTEGRLKQHVQRFHNDSPSGSFEDTRHLADTPVGGANELTPSENDNSPLTPSSASKTSCRQKVYRCKQCDFVATVKTEFWQHARIHIKDDKLLQCPKSPFVTEYKHHLEYHLRNHFGSKPFKCSKCNYACVNKSMLNSHMKSHTNIYQYRCADCTYATKYCHSLKLHLRKYNHKPASILNLDGSVEHDTSALLTSKKGAQKTSKCKDEKESETSVLGHQTSNGAHPFAPAPPHLFPFWPLTGGMRPPPPLIPAAMGNFFRGLLPPQMMKQSLHTEAGCSFPTMVGLQCKMCDFNGQSQDELMQHTFKTHGINNNRDVPGMFVQKTEPKSDSCTLNGEINPNYLGLKLPAPIPCHSIVGNALANNVMELSKMPNPVHSEVAGETPLDLSKPQNYDELSDTPTDTPLGRKRSRKGKAFKLDALCLRLQEKMDAEDKDEASTTTSVDQSSSTPSESKCVPDDSPKAVIQSSTTPIMIKKDQPEQNNNIVSPKEPAIPAEMQNMMVNNNRFLFNNTNMGDLLAASHDRYCCHFCDITFSNCVMYTMHMGYHGYQNPFKCNMCGIESSDKVSFFLHIARAAHA